LKVENDYQVASGCALILVSNPLTGNIQQAKQMQKRTEITIETERLLIVSQRRERTIQLCGDCDQKVPMLTVYEAARAARTTPLVIFGLAEAGRLHLVVTTEGQLFICPNSLTTLGRQGRPK
jgi:hypothetical protein